MLESFLFEKPNNISNLQNKYLQKEPSESFIIQNCMAKCNARSHAPASHLWLRKNVFYGRIELPRVNGKRRYKCFSLHTKDYYEARALMDKQKQLEKDLQDLCKLYAQLIFEEDDFFSDHQLFKQKNF